MVLSRQKLPVLDRAALGPASGTRRGGYVLLDSPGGNPQAILIATGSEVHVALAAARLLQADRVRVRVVSLPCWELFAAQPEGYRNEVLPPNVRIRLGIEAASGLASDVQETDPLLPLLAPYPVDAMEAYLVSRFVNSPSIDEPACVEPVS